LSLLASSIEGKRTELSITNCNVIGNIDYSESESFSKVYVGAIASKLWKDDLVYNCTVTSDIKITGSDMNVGLVAGENNGFISTVHTSGSINAGYYSMGDGYIGGITGVNGKASEVKNASTSATINFDQDIAFSGDKELATGGITGLNNGVISYTTSDATLNVSKTDAIVYMGSIAGRGDGAIYYNIIARGSLNPNKCKHIYIADVVGYSKYGYYEKVITNVNINVDNSAISSKVNLGLVTIFENLGEAFDTEAKYNAEFTPNFKSILIGGTVKVFTNEPVSSGNFLYNLGLRNEYEQYQTDEDGKILTEIIPGEDGEDVEIPLTETHIPNIYSSLYILENYSLQKHKVVDGVATLEPALKITYAKDANGNQCVTKRTLNVAMQLNFFVVNLGFNYIVGNNEIDLSSYEIPKMKFTLSKEDSLEQYFRYDKKDYNGTLTAFDKEVLPSAATALIRYVYSYPFVRPFTVADVPLMFATTLYAPLL
jgi:hypothetical protein